MDLAGAGCRGGDLLVCGLYKARTNEDGIRPDKHQVILASTPLPDQPQDLIRDRGKPAWNFANGGISVVDDI